MGSRTVITLLLLPLLCAGYGPAAQKQAARKKAGRKIMQSAVFIIAKNDFRDEEYLRPKEILEKAGVKTFTASSKTGEVNGLLGAKAKADILVKDVKPENYDAVIFIGGPGAQEYFDDPAAHNVAVETVKHDKLLGAICIAPVTLARAGVLKNKKATCFYSMRGELKAHGALVSEEPVVEDGKLVTADGPGSAKEFGALLLKNLSKK
jgi:protease I